jgi:hypothetical protein
VEELVGRWDILQLTPMPRAVLLARLLVYGCSSGTEQIFTPSFRAAGLRFIQPWFTTTPQIEKETGTTLLEHGADKDKDDEQRVTALLLACHKRRWTAARILLAENANPSTASKTGETALRCSGETSKLLPWPSTKVRMSILGTRKATPRFIGRIRKAMRKSREYCSQRLLRLRMGMGTAVR